MLFYASINPLFEWQISEVVTDFPSSYEVHILHSPWRAYLGNSLNDKSYVFAQIQVSENDKACSVSDLSSVVNRSRKDELLEQLSLTRQFNYDRIDWVMGWLLIEVVLSVAYGLWFTNWHEHRPVSDAIIPAVVATICFCIIFSQVMRVWGARVAFDGIANCHGIITFNANLSKISYSIVILLFTGIFAELVALAIMIYQVAIAVSKRRESSKSSVG